MADELRRSASSSSTRRVSKVAGGRLRTSTTGRRVTSGRFTSGARVRVRFGANDQPAVVLEQRGDRVRVGINLDGVEEQIVSTYPSSEVQPV